SGCAGGVEAPRATCVIPPIRVEASPSMLISPSIRHLGGLMGYGRGREGPGTFCVLPQDGPHLCKVYLHCSRRKVPNARAILQRWRPENEIKDCSDYYRGIVVYRTTVTRRSARRIRTLRKPLEELPVTLRPARGEPRVELDQLRRCAIGQV